MGSDVNDAIALMRKFEANGNQSAKGEAGATMSAALTLAHLYLAEHPADDDEPITEEWLRSVVPVLRSVTREDCTEYLIAGKLDVECYFGRRWVLVCGPLIVELKDRGHAKRLLSDLGIQAKGTDNG